MTDEGPWVGVGPPVSVVGWAQGVVHLSARWLFSRVVLKKGKCGRTWSKGRLLERWRPAPQFCFLKAGRAREISDSRLRNVQPGMRRRGLLRPALVASHRRDPARKRNVARDSADSIAPPSRGDEKGWTDRLLRSETSQKGLLADRELSEEVDEFDHEVELLSE